MTAWRLHDLRRTAPRGWESSESSRTSSRPRSTTCRDFAPGSPACTTTPVTRGRCEAALTAWDEHVMAIVKGRVRGDRIVPLRRALNRDGALRES